MHLSIWSRLRLKHVLYITALKELWISLWHANRCTRPQSSGRANVYPERVSAGVIIIIPRPVQDSSCCINHMTNHKVTRCIDVQSAPRNGIKMCWSQVRGRRRTQSGARWTESWSALKKLVSHKANNQQLHYHLGMKSTFDSLQTITQTFSFTFGSLF